MVTQAEAANATRAREGAPPTRNIAPVAAASVTAASPASSRERMHVDAVHRDTTHIDSAHPDVTHPDVTHPDVTHPDVTHPDVTHPDVTHTHAPHTHAPHPDAPLEVSAETGRGLAALLDAVQREVGRTHAAPTDVPLVTRARHRHALAVARAEVAAFAEAWRADVLPSPVAAVHLRTAVGALDDLVGAIDVDEVLGRVFATFCVGK